MQKWCNYLLSLDIMEDMDFVGYIESMHEKLKLSYTFPPFHSCTSET